MLTMPAPADRSRAKHTDAKRLSTMLLPGSNNQDRPERQPNRQISRNIAYRVNDGLDELRHAWTRGAHRGNREMVGAMILLRPGGSVGPAHPSLQRSERPHKVALG
jgi:hypothetical protein